MNRAVVNGQRIQKQIMAERLQNKERAFDERITQREVLIVPDSLTLKRGKMGYNPSQSEQQNLEPGPAENGRKRRSVYPAITRVYLCGASASLAGHKRGEGSSHFPNDSFPAILAKGDE